ncbi:MAG: o-succinylbenzoate synthase [Candidatus Polarisedimenticolaceae bacterium]|nr:o-succinylbenzoate synthase [Candidatus Polarisedimenticolaceae bacterium]
MRAHWKKYRLKFRHPAGTSRGTLYHRDLWFLFLTRNGVTGIGECAPLPGLGLDNIDEIETRLEQLCARPDWHINNLRSLVYFPSLRFALEMAQLDLEHGGRGRYFPARDKTALDINGLIWMGDADFMRAQIDEKLSAGWRCIKIKIGGLDFARELEMLQQIRQRHGPDELELRLDANGAFTRNNVRQRLQQLAEFRPHSIEQPVAAGQWDVMAEICRDPPIPIALDEELLPLVSFKKQVEMLDWVMPQYLVLKPGLLGGFAASRRWIELAEERGIGCWVTSALESNVGLDAIYQWTQSLSLKGFQGLGTGQLFNNNLPSPLSMRIKNGQLSRHSSPIWDEIHRCMVEWLHPSPTIGLQTSGSTGAPRKVIMKKSWMKSSARLTAGAFALKRGERALLCLSPQFIAGRMMLVRAMHLGLDLEVVEPSSDPLAEICGEIDFAAMTPRQLSCSIARGRLEKVKTLLVGGAQVSPVLAKQVQMLKTRVFESWGMTETVSHVAIRPLNGACKSDCFSALPGIRFSQDERGCLVVQANHLGGEAIVTNDIVELLSHQRFRWLGRYDNVINSGGVKIFPERIEQKLATCLAARQFYITATADELLGQKVVLLIEGEPFPLPQGIWSSLAKYEKPREVRFLSKFSRTESGKIIRGGIE